jgi:hypothetical protein
MSCFENFKVKSVLADSFYGTESFISEAANITRQKQVISQIKKTQLINVNGRNVTVHDFFNNYQGKTEYQELRNKNKKITYRSGKFKVKSHNKKYYIIALKYENESEYRYLIANDMSWRDIDIIKAYALRWLVEVFIQDWKSYEGWNQLAKQRGIDPACTAGSLREKVMMESLSELREIIGCGEELGVINEALDITETSSGLVHNSASQTLVR